MTEQQASDRILVARIGAAYGVKGWVKLISFTDPLENILSYQTFYSLEAASLVKLEILESKAHGKGFVALIKGCDDRDLTRQYTGKDLYIEKSFLPDLEPGHYYWYQLEGLRVKTSNGEDLGRVEHLLETGANDVLVVNADEQSIDSEDRLIPYLRDQVILNVDIDAGEISVDWGLDWGLD